MWGHLWDPSPGPPLGRVPPRTELHCLFYLGYFVISLHKSLRKGDGSQYYICHCPAFFPNHDLIAFSLPLRFYEPVVPLAPTGSKDSHSVMPWVINLWLVSSHLSWSVCGAHSSRRPDNWSNPPSSGPSSGREAGLEICGGQGNYSFWANPWGSSQPPADPHHPELCFCKCLSASPSPSADLSVRLASATLLPWPEKCFFITEQKQTNIWRN